MEIYGYVIGGDFYKVGSLSLSEEMKQKSTPVVRLQDIVLPQSDVIKSLPSDGQIIQKRKDILNDGKPRTEDEFAIELVRWAKNNII